MSYTEDSVQMLWSRLYQDHHQIYKSHLQISALQITWRGHGRFWKLRAAIHLIQRSHTNLVWQIVAKFSAAKCAN